MPLARRALAAFLALGAASAFQGHLTAQAQVNIQVPPRTLGAPPASPPAPATPPTPNTTPNRAPPASPTAPSTPPARNTSPSPLLGRWSESGSCSGTATQFVFTASTFEIIGRDGRWYLADVAYGRRDNELAVHVTAAPTFTRLGRAGPGVGDTYVFRNDPVNRITPLVILRANGRRDEIRNDTPVFTRCR
jgi:hypothetical protein